MKKQVLLFSALLLASLYAFAENKVADLRSGGRFNTTTAPLSGVCAYTMEAWFKGSNQTQGYARIISFSNNTLDISTGMNTVRVYDGGWRNTGVTFTSTEWHHVAVTNDLTNMKVYVDGVQVYTKASAARDFSNKLLYIGADAFSPNSLEQAMSLVDEVRIWNRALSALEITIVSRQQLVGNENGLVACYDFNGSTGANKVGSALALTGANSYSFIVQNYGEYIYDYAMSFDGIDDRLSMATPIAGNADFTLETQFKTSEAVANKYRRIFGWTNFAFEVAINNGRIYTYKSTWSSVSTATFNDNQWHHLALTKSGTTINIYVDGNLLGSRTLTLNLTGNMYAGGVYSINSTDDQYIGQLDEIRVWNTVRTQPQIEADMNKVLVGNEVGLVQYFDFNTPTSASNIANLNEDGELFLRSGASGANNLPQFVSATKNEITTSVSELFINEKELLSVYPNPFTDVVNINVNDASRIVVLDAAGKEMMNVNVNSTQIDLSSLNQGVYFLQVFNKEEIKTAKLIKN